MPGLHAPGGVIGHGLALPESADLLERAPMRAIGGVYRHQGGEPSRSERDVASAWSGLVECPLRTPGLG